LRHCSSAQLRRDRQLDWSWEASALVRWVQALMPFAPAQFIDPAGGQCQVRAAAVHEERGVAVPGTVLETRGGSVRVACRGGSVWLECCARPKLHVGDLLGGGTPHHP